MTQTLTGPATGNSTPAHSPEIEQSLLGTLIFAPALISNVMAVLDASDFYNPNHSTLFDVLCDLSENGAPVHPPVLISRLRDLGELDRLGGPGFIASLSRFSLPSAAMHMAEEIREKSNRRRLAALHHQQIHRASSGQDTTSEDLISEAQTALDEIAEQRGVSQVGSVGTALDDTLDEIERLGNADGGVTGLSTGFYDLDRMTYGLHPGQMICIAARPGVGKSTLGLDICRSVAVNQNKAAAFFSLEMNRTEITMRMLSAECRVDLGKIRSGNLDDRDWQRLADKTEAIKNAPLYIDDTPGLTMGAIRAQARRLKQRYDLQLLTIDYLQLVTLGKSVNSRQEEVSTISRQCKLIAKELQIPVIVMSQLNRGNENRTDPRPKMSDLRESGAIEQDSDAVILIHREEMYDPETPRVGEADLIIPKQRSASTGVCTLLFQGQFSRFADLAQV